MNPEPVIVMAVAGEPAMAEAGMIAVTPGKGFEIGGRIEGAVVDPPQPVIAHIPSMKADNVILVVDFRSATGLHEIKASILSILQI